jgi:hypothetical protein
MGIGQMTIPIFLSTLPEGMSRPDQTNFSWQVGDNHRTFTAKTPTLTYLDDSCLAVAYLPNDKTYVFGVTNQQDFIVKVMQG